MNLKRQGEAPFFTGHQNAPPALRIPGSREETPNPLGSADSLLVVGESESIIKGPWRPPGNDPWRKRVKRTFQDG